MRRHCAATIILLFLAGTATAGQARFSPSDTYFCSYDGTLITDDVYTFASDAEAEALISRILEQAGLEPNFSVRAANVANAAAAIDRNTRPPERVILYNQGFVEDLRGRTGSEWAPTSVLAHEIGHHIQGHTLDTEGSRPETELEADKWSGFVLYRMGASLPQAKIAMESVGNSRGTETHPPKSARLAAITNGWKSAQDLDGATPDEETPEPVSSKSGNPILERRDPPGPEDTTRPEDTPRGMLVGRWQNNLGSVMDVAHDYGNQYVVREYNLMGQIGQGLLQIEGSRVALQLVSFGIEVRCELALSGTQMSGTCVNGLMMSSPVVLQRVY